MTLSIMREALEEFTYGIVGLLRKRAKHRCSKRGEKWDKYVEAVKKVQREIGEKDFREMMKVVANAENPFLKMIGAGGNDYSFSGGYFPIPELGSYFLRKRSKYRSTLNGKKK